MALLLPSAGGVRLPSTSTTVQPKIMQYRNRVNASASASASANTSIPPRSISYPPPDPIESTSNFFQHDSRPIMLFDGVCNLCNGGVKFVRNHDQQRRIRFEALQSEDGKKLLTRAGRAPDDISSVVLVEKDRSYIKSEAVLKIMEYIDMPFPQLAFFFKFLPIFLRDFAYDNVANNRYVFFGRTDSCEI